MPGSGGAGAPPYTSGPARSLSPAGLQARDGGGLGHGGRHPSKLSMNRETPTAPTDLFTGQPADPSSCLKPKNLEYRRLRPNPRG